MYFFLLTTYSNYIASIEALALLDQLKKQQKQKIEKRTIFWRQAHPGFLEINIPKRYRSSQRKCFTKRLSLKLTPYLQKNTSVGVSFLIKLQAFISATLLKRDSNTGISSGYCKIFKNTHFKEDLRTTAFDHRQNL